MKKQLLLYALLWSLGLQAATATPAPALNSAQELLIHKLGEQIERGQQLLVKKNREQSAYKSLIKSISWFNPAGKAVVPKILAVTLLQVATTYALHRLPQIGTRFRKFDTMYSTPFLYSNQSMFRNPRGAAATAGLIALNGTIWAAYYAALSSTLDRYCTPSYRTSLANFLDIWHTIPDTASLHKSLLKVIVPLHAQLVAARTAKPHKTTVQLLPLTEQASKKLLCYIITAAHLKKNALAVEISVLLKKIDDYKKQQLEAEFEDEDDDDDLDYDSPGETVAPKPSTQQAPGLDYDFDDDDDDDYSDDDAATPTPTKPQPQHTPVAQHTPTTTPLDNLDDEDDDLDVDDSDVEKAVAPTSAKPLPQQKPTLQPTTPITHAYDDDEDDLDEDE